MGKTLYTRLKRHESNEKPASKLVFLAFHPAICGYCVKLGVRPNFTNRLPTFTCYRLLSRSLIIPLLLLSPQPSVLFAPPTNEKAYSANPVVFTRIVSSCRSKPGLRIRL